MNTEGPLICAESAGQIRSSAFQIRNNRSTLRRTWHYAKNVHTCRSNDYYIVMLLKSQIRIGERLNGVIGLSLNA